MEELKCPKCGARLRYIFKVDGEASMDSNGSFQEHGHITEEVRCNVCMDVALPTKLVEAMKRQCRERTLMETMKWRTL